MMVVSATMVSTEAKPNPPTIMIKKKVVGSFTMLPMNREINAYERKPMKISKIELKRILDKIKA